MGAIRKIKTLSSKKGQKLERMAESSWKASSIWPGVSGCKCSDEWWCPPQALGMELLPPHPADSALIGHEQGPLHIEKQHEARDLTQVWGAEKDRKLKSEQMKQ